MNGHTMEKPDAEVPPLDTVLAWVTYKVERDYEARGVFSQLRLALAKDRRDNATLYYLSSQEAEAVLADAQHARVAHGVRGMGFAYRCHANALRKAMDEAAVRASKWGGHAPLNLWRDKSSECWQGTKAQLLAHGIRLDWPWPGEPGGRSRKAWGTDDRGHPVEIIKDRLCHWPGRFEAIIRFPSSAYQADEEKPASRKTDPAETALYRLQSMPNSADEFRGKVVSCLRDVLRIGFDLVNRPTQHGFLLTDVEGIHEAFDAIAEAVMAAPVSFDAKRHAEIAQGLRVEIAAAGGPVRAKVADLCKPNPAILAGSLQ